MSKDISAVMYPKLIRIGDACYRRMDCEPDGVIVDLSLNFDPKSLKNPQMDSKSEGNKDRYLMEELERDDFQDDSPINDDDDDSCDFQLIDGEEFRSDNHNGCILKMHVCNTFFGCVIGKHGQTRRNIELETRTTIKIPRDNRGPDANFIQICGQNKRSTILTYKRISDLVQKFRGKQNLTHFISIPLSLDSNLKNRFLEFKKQILSDTECSLSKGIDESVFQSESRIHITLCVLYCGDSHERKLATKTLQDLNQSFLTSFKKKHLKDFQKLKLHIKGLDVMNDDPTEANVLYAKTFEADTFGLFQEITNHLYECFSESGLLCDTRNFDECSSWKIKIHATLMNTRYGKENEKSKDLKRKMDVSKILEKYGDFDFGIVTFDQIHLSEHNYYDDNGYYRSVSVINF